MTESSGPWKYRRLRHSDVPEFLKVVFLGIGNFERVTGLDRSADATIRQLSRRSVWLLLGFLTLIGRSPVEVYVATDGHRVAGTGTLLVLSKAGYVAGMVTGPEYRSQGVASRILEVLREAAARRHRDWLVLDTESDNETALRVYRRAGYREAARFAWYVRTGLPPAEVGTALVRPRPARKSELKAVAATLDAGRPPEFRAALPSRPGLLSHSELLATGRGVRKSSWIRRGVGGALIVLSACYVPGSNLGMYCPVTGAASPTSEDVAGLFDAATEWFRPRNPERCLAVVAEPTGSLGATLESLGFARVGASTTMIRPSAPGD
jgi:ribosomal-protein-alanine N-acetyltransferase